MFNRLLPRTVDNTYRGHRLAPWLLALVVAVRILQSMLMIFNGYSTARSADGIPLDTFPPAAAQTVMSFYTLYAVGRLFISLLCVVVLVRYRGAIPFMFALLLLTYLAGRLSLQFFPLPREGTAPSSLMSRALLALTVVGLGLSLWKRGDQRARE